MFFNTKLQLIRALRITWKVNLWMIVLCVGAYLLETYVVRGRIHIPGAIPALLATSLAFFIGFNNNQGYSRWWEARTAWGGIMNGTRLWTRSILAYTQVAQQEALHDHTTHVGDVALRMIRRNLGFLHAFKSALRDTNEQVYRNYLDPADLEALTGCTNLSAALLDLQAHDLQKLREAGQVDGFTFLALHDLLVRFSDNMGKCERIKNTLFPATYLYFTQVFIWLMIAVLTMDIVEEAGVWAIGLSWLVGFVFHVTHWNGLSLMNPFDHNPACVPLDSLLHTVEINVLQMLKFSEVPNPVEASNGESV